MSEMLRQPESQDISQPHISHMNPTKLPDAWMRSWIPIFLIRHPALVFESWYRREQDASVDVQDWKFAIFTSFGMLRSIFDYYLLSHSPDTRESSSLQLHPKPFVLDASNLLKGDPALEALCELTGMNKEDLLFEWEPKSEDNTPACSSRHQRFLETLWNSSGIEATRLTSRVDLAEKRKEWDSLFGPEVASALACRVDQAMPDYRYLSSFKVGKSAVESLKAWSDCASQHREQDYGIRGN
jgi:hypothetical protein